MIEQSVVKHDDKRDRILRKALRVLQVVLLMLTGIGLVFGFTIASVFWDTDRSVFWQAAFSMVLLTLPVLCVAAILEWRIQKLCVQFDYVVSDNALAIWRISGNRRTLWMTIPFASLSFCKKYDDLDETERAKLAHARFACCNADDPRLTLLVSDEATVGKQNRSVTVLLEPNDELFRTLRRAAKGNG